MTADKLLTTLQHLETELHQEETRRDASRMAALLHPEFQEFGRSGRGYSRTEILEEFSARDAEFPTVVSWGYSVAILAEHIALLTYMSAHEDKAGHVHRQTLRSSLWVRTSEGWQVRFHQGTPTSENEHSPSGQLAAAWHVKLPRYVDSQTPRPLAVPASLDVGCYVKYRAEFDLDRSYFEESFDQWLRYRSRYRRWQVRLSVLLIVLGLLFVGRAPIWLTVGTFIVGFVELIEFFFYRHLWIAKRIQARLDNAGTHVELEIGDTGIYQKGPTGEGTILWQGVKKAIPTEKGIFLSIGDGMSIYIPGASVGDPQFKDYVLENVRSDT